MPGGIGIRPVGGRLDLELGAGAGLRRLEAVCRLGRTEGAAPRELVARRWRRHAAGWTAECGPLEIRIAAHESGGAVELSLSARAHERVIVEAIGLRGEPLIGGAGPSLLAESGYQSWDDSLVWWPGDKPVTRSSWWTAGLGGGAAGALGFAARSARLHGTRFEWRPGCGFAALQVGEPGANGGAPVWRARGGGRFEAEVVAAAAGADLGAALELAAGHLRPARHPAPRGWLSWYHHGPSVTRADVLASAAEIRTEPYRGLGLEVVQVDDGWQIAYGDWVPNTKFAPLDRLCAELRGQGQVPGVWTAPFLVSISSDLCDLAPSDWFVEDPASGTSLIDPRHFVFGPMRVLDARRPAVREHLEGVFRALRQQGFSYFKIDFLYAGAYAGFPALRAGIRAIRRGIGKDAYLLACGAPLLPVAGLVDGCRIGPDACTPFYDFEKGAAAPTFFGEEVQAVARAAALRRHLHGWYQLDPDVAMATTSLEPGRARQLITAAALTGGLFFLGDALAELPGDRRRLVANPEIAELPRGGPATPDLAHTDAGAAPTIWSRSDGIVAIFNWSGEVLKHPLEVDRDTPIRDLWQRSEVTAGAVEVPPHDVRVLRLGGGRL